MCGSLLSKIRKSGNRVTPAPSTGSLEPKRVPMVTKLADELTETRVSSPIERVLGQHEDTDIKASESTNKGTESESKAEARATEIESAAAKMMVEPSTDCPRDILPVCRPTIDINKVKEVVAKDMARLRKLEVKRMLARGKVAETVSKEELAKENLAKETLHKEKLAKEKLMVREKLEVIQGGPSSSTNTVFTKPISPARSILLGKTKSAIAFEVLVGSKRKDTVLLSARVPRRLRRLDNPPQLTAEVMSAKQLAAQEKRVKELERVRDCAHASAQTARRNYPVNDT